MTAAISPISFALPPSSALVRALIEEHACLNWTPAGDVASSIGRLADDCADVAVIPLAQLPYPLPLGVEVVSLLEGEHVLLGRARRPHLRARFYNEDLRRDYGKVWLVGMGPGDPELMTLKADKVLRRADVIFYDSLIDASVLDHYQAEKVHVGKRKGKHTQQQESINKLLCAAARSGKLVVRLKGGDPFIFGRGGEEAEYLLRRLIPVEVVPGVSAANAAAAAANVPLTKRGRSRSLLLETMHEGLAPASKEATRVFFMGASRLAALSQRLLREGADLCTPVTLVQNASFATERSVTTTVSGMEAINLASPLMVIVGEVARERRTDGKCLFTGTDPYRFACPERVVHFPLDEGGKPRPIALDEFAAVAFTRPQAVDAFVTAYAPSNELLYYCASPDVQTRVRMLMPTAATVLCCCR